MLPRARAQRPRVGFCLRCTPFLLGAAFLGQLRFCFVARGGPRTRSSERPLRGKVARLAALGDAAERLEIKGDLEPLGSHVLVRTDHFAEQTESGLLLPKAAQDAPNEGTIVAVGPGLADAETGVVTPMTAKLGSKAVYFKFAEFGVTVDGVKHSLISDEDILLTYEGDEATLENVNVPRGKVLIKMTQDKEMTADGIALSKGAGKAETTVGEVVAIGQKNVDRNGKEVSHGIELGDMVRFRYGEQVDMMVSNEEFTMVDVEDCLLKWRV